MRELFVNEDITFETTFLDDSGVAYNQTSVSLVVITPEFEVINITTSITNPSPGVYQRVYRVLLPGFYAYIYTGVDAFGKQSIQSYRIQIRQAS